MNVFRDAVSLLTGAPWAFHAGVVVALVAAFAFGVHRGRGSARRRHAGT